ncbi:hypothetical protein DPMN_111703 [Dreissena polymorpha]|uniref:SLC26A/SulP transporter domain-containing protein n=1 Tax=Dreissena polymorpha TaxID=45954 RepID=A0A9D4KEC2_DREPO|nr:hypothetical protein DPMN_111703 [Dreissena polymorpha]
MTVFSFNLPQVISMMSVAHKNQVPSSKTWISIFKNIHTTNAAPVIISAICILVLYLVKAQVNERFKAKLPVPIPIEIVVVILSTIACHFGKFPEKFKV